MKAAAFVPDEPTPCQDDPEMWFPAPAAAGGRDESRRARKLCSQCPAQQACLDFALEHDEAYGIWGGLTALQRAALRLVPGQAR